MEAERVSAGEVPWEFRLLGKPELYYEQVFAARLSHTPYNMALAYLLFRGRVSLSALQTEIWPGSPGEVLCENAVGALKRLRKIPDGRSPNLRALIGVTDGNVSLETGFTTDVEHFQQSVDLARSLAFPERIPFLLDAVRLYREDYLLGYPDEHSSLVRQKGSISHKGKRQPSGRKNWIAEERARLRALYFDPVLNFLAEDLRRIEHTSVPYIRELAEACEEAAASGSLLPERHRTQLLKRLASNLPSRLWGGMPFLGASRLQEAYGWKERLLEPSTQRLVFCGSGGLGKTRTAIHIAQMCLGLFADGIWFVSLEEASTADTMLARIGDLRLFPKRLRTQQALEETLREKEVLLILDSAERVEQAEEVVSRLQSVALRLKVLVTSRVRWTGEGTIALPALIQTDREQLFVAYALHYKREFVADETNREDIAHICRHLGGTPLWIQLVAFHIYGRTPREILAELADRDRLLRTRDPEVPERQRTEQAVYDWSFDALGSARLQTLFIEVSVFAGGFTAEAARDICVSSDTGEDLGELCRYSMLYERIDPTTQETRFFMLDPVRRYAHRRLEESGTADSVRRRQIDYFVSIAEQASQELTGQRQGAWLRRLDVERDNLRVCLLWCQQAPSRLASGLRLVASLWRFWETRGYVSEGWELARGILDLASLAPSEASTPQIAITHVQALNGAANLARDQGYYAKARTIYEEALDLARTHESRQAQGAILNNLGNLACDGADYAIAQSLYSDALPINRRLDNAWQTATSLSGLGTVALYLEKFAAAKDFLGQALAIQHRLGNLSQIAKLTSDLGVVAFYEKDYDVAYSLCMKALPMHRALGSRAQEANCLNCLGHIALQRGDYSDAIARLQSAVKIQVETGDIPGLVTTLIGQGRLARTMNDISAARAFLCKALQRLSGTHNPREAAYALEEYALAARIQKRFALAVYLWAATARWHEEVKSPPRDLDDEDAREMDALRTHMEYEPFDLAWKQGYASTLEQAIQFTLKDDLMC